MGCSNGREGSSLSALSCDCNNLIEENLEMLTIIEYLMIGKNKTSTAISLISIKKRTEEYYKIISRFRQFWISRAKKSLDNEIYSTEIVKCENEINKEKNLLNKCKENLEKIITWMSPGWNTEHSTLSEWKLYLESLPHVAQMSTTLYENYYMSRKDSIKQSLKAQNSQMDLADTELLKTIKSLTIAPYKNPKQRIYHTEEIKHIDDKEKVKRLMTQEIGSGSKKKKKKLIKELKKKRTSPNEKSQSKTDSRQEKSKTIIKDDSSLIKDDSSFSIASSDNDEELVSRLSISQK